MNHALFRIRIVSVLTLFILIVAGTACGIVVGDETHRNESPTQQLHADTTGLQNTDTDHGGVSNPSTPRRVSILQTVTDTDSPEPSAEAQNNTAPSTSDRFPKTYEAPGRTAFTGIPGDLGTVALVSVIVIASISGVVLRFYQ